MANSELTITAKGWRYSHPLAFDKYRYTSMFLSVVILIVLSVLDYFTGYEFGFFIFYFVPVALAAWYGGKKEGIAMAIMCGICWYTSDRLTHHPYSKPYFIYWETFMRLVSFLTTSLTLSRIRDLVLNEEQLLHELLATREELNQYRQSNSEYTSY
jgi:K+-sensing histidine kinase KdpD